MLLLLPPLKLAPSLGAEAGEEAGDDDDDDVDEGEEGEVEEEGDATIGRPLRSKARAQSGL